MSNVPATVAPTRRGLWRWSVALLATLLMVVAGSGLVAFAQSGAGASRGPAYLPADAAVYVEGRLDLPAGQADAMAEFMSAFPGFADTGSFMMKLGEALDGITSEATDGAVSFTEDMAPFMTGEIGLGLMDLAGVAMGATEPEVLIGVAISDQAAADAFISDLAQSGGAELTEEAHGDTSILSDGQMSLAVAADWILLAPTSELVKTGLDVLTGAEPSLVEQPAFAEAWARVPAGHLVGAYMNLQSFGSLLELAGSAATGQTGFQLDTEQLLAQLPTDMVAFLAAESDRMTLEAFITPAEQTPALAVGESDLATRFPADSQLYVETRELGALLETALGGLFASMDEEAAAGLAPFEDMLGAPLPSLLDFVSDASLGASITSDGLWLGIAAEVSDEDVAAERLERILSFVRLLGSGLAGEDAPAISIDETVIAETDVTVITLPVEAMSDGSLPVNIPDTLSIALSDGTLLIGLGDFVENALTQAEADSLAASPGYVDALGEDTSNSGVMFVNVGSLLGVLDPMLGMMAPEWADIAPYATAIDRIIAVASADDEVISTRMSVIVAP